LHVLNKALTADNERAQRKAHEAEDQMKRERLVLQRAQERARETESKFVAGESKIAELQKKITLMEQQIKLTRSLLQETQARYLPILTPKSTNLNPKP
jgi:polyhydroxyalkanoate synthesis regulator protein